MVVSMEKKVTMPHKYWKYSGTRILISSIQISSFVVVTRVSHMLKGHNGNGIWSLQQQDFFV